VKLTGIQDTVHKRMPENIQIFQGKFYNNSQNLKIKQKFIFCSFILKDALYNSFFFFSNTSKQQQNCARKIFFCNLLTLEEKDIILKKSKIVIAIENMRITESE